MLEKGWNPKLLFHTFEKDLADIHSTASRFKLLLDKVKHHANQSIDDAFVYAIKKWDKIHKTPELKVGDLILVSTLNFDNIRSPKKLKHSFSGLFIIKALHGKNAVQVGLSGELENKNTDFPVSLLNHYTSSDKELFPLRNETPLEVPPLYKSEEKNVLRVFKERRLRGKMKENTLSDKETHSIQMRGFQKVKYLITRRFSEDSDMRKDQFLNKNFELCALHT
ncbi:hypothetical protein O181_008471 [Austropuccinia psidii MF-1]|uniref:Uncharacterized protein n=1 Tax=Austropuccinia psidii MF-1 TaxID=1389203 RepID=A0A9Q3BPX4_9BASI|nr:hypothetical protein [Austropuccinia psidii MF-1]